MHYHALLALVIPFAGSLGAAEPTALEAVTSAANKLGEKSSYSWRREIIVPPTTQYKVGGAEGRTEKNGYTFITYFEMENGRTNQLTIIKDGKAVINNSKGGWDSLDDLDETEDQRRYILFRLGKVKRPATDAAELAASASNLRKENETYVGVLPEDYVTSKFPGNVSNPKAAVRFWIKDGVLDRYEVKSSGKAVFKSIELDADQKMTVEIKDVDTTTVQIPEVVKQKLP